MGPWGNIILSNAKPILKKTIPFFFLLLLPFALSADITVNWQPQVGVSYTWYQKINPASHTSFGFFPGFSGGAAAEVRFGSLIGLKAGIGVSQLVTREFSYYTNIYGVSDTYGFQRNQVMLEAPASAMFYYNLTDSTDIFAAIGAVPSIMNCLITGGYDSTGKLYPGSEIFKTINKYYTGLSAELGTHWALGPGKITAGFQYTLYLINDSYFGNAHNVKFYAGYLF